MLRGLRPLVRLLAGLSTLVLTGIGSVAYASVPIHDPVSDGIPALGAAPATIPSPSLSGASFAEQVGWMASGAAVVLLAGAVLFGLAVLSRRHRVHSRQLQMP